MKRIRRLNLAPPPSGGSSLPPPATPGIMPALERELSLLSSLRTWRRFALFMGWAGFVLGFCLACALMALKELR